MLTTKGYRREVILQDIGTAPKGGWRLNRPSKGIIKNGRKNHERQEGVIIPDIPVAIPSGCVVWWPNSSMKHAALLRKLQVQYW